MLKKLSKLMLKFKSLVSGDKDVWGKDFNYLSKWRQSLNKLLINRNLTVAKVHEGSKHLGKIKGYGSIENKINSVKLNVNCSKESQKRLRDWGNTC